MKKTVLYALLVTLISVLTLLLNACSSVTPTPAPTLTPVATATPLPPTFTPAPTATPLPPTATAIVPYPTIFSKPQFSLLSFTFVDALHGWAIGSETSIDCYCIAIRLTKDGGKTWQATSFPEVAAHTSDIPDKIRFVNLQDGWVYGAHFLYSTHDGGQTWQEEQHNDKILTILPLGNSVWRIEFDCSAPKPRSICDYNVYSSINGGQNWQLLPGRPFISLFENQASFVRSTSQDAIMFDKSFQANGKILVTHDSGNSWQDFSTPCKDLSINQIVALDNQQLWLLCTSSNANWQNKKLYSTLDGGKNWNLLSMVYVDEKQGNIPFYGYTVEMLFTTTTHGYMLMGKAPLYKTDDGGKNWYLANITGLDLFKDWTHNLIFVDPKHGWFMSGGADFAIYRTTDAGTTWEKFPIK